MRVADLIAGIETCLQRTRTVFASERCSHPNGVRMDVDKVLDRASRGGSSPTQSRVGTEATGPDLSRVKGIVGLVAEEHRAYFAIRSSAARRLGVRPMRRRRPSALYSVLDEEQLLGGVDLTDHPDPVAAGSSEQSGGGLGDWDEWSPDGDAGVDWGLDEEGGAGVWSPDDADPTDVWSPGDADLESVWSPDVGRVSAGEQPSPSISPSPGRGRRAMRVGVVFVGAAVAVLLIVRTLGTELAGVGQRPRPRPEASPATGALPAMSRQPAGATGQPRRVTQLPAARTDARPGQSGPVMASPAAGASTRPPSRRHATVVPAKRGGVDRPASQGPAGAPSDGPTPSAEASPSPVRPVDGGRAGAGAKSGRAGSPEPEFGFER
jgi:hypothetical protein